MHVLRLCSVFEPDPGGLGSGAARFDPIGGMQNHTGALTRCLDDEGVSQTVVTSRLGGPPARTTRGERTRVVRVGAPVPRLRQLWGLAALPHVLRPGRPVDVVHAHQGEDVATLLLARLAAARHRCPLVVTVHCSVRHTVTGRSPRALFLRLVGGAVEARVLARADAVVALARRTAQLLRRDGVPADAVHVIPSGFEPGTFGDRDREDAFAGFGRPRVGFVGRLAPSKRPDLLVRAFAAMSREASLVVVGDGPLRERVEEMAASSVPRGRVHLQGFVEHTQVPRVLASLDVLVLPSEYEELGSVLVEAMAAGVPVVATDVGGIPEVVRDGETGLLVPPGDVAALTAALDRLTADRELRRRLGEAARDRAQQYAWPVLARRVLAVYAERGRSRPRAGSVPAR